MLSIAFWVEGSVCQQPQCAGEAMLTRADYLHLTKRFGIVAASQLPLHYLLSLKTPFSPLQVLLGRSHETLINAHQLLGRIIITLFYAHVVLYINFFIQNNLLAKFLEFYIICGLVAIVAYTVIATTALDAVRRWSYRVFYTLHVGLALALLPTLFFHVHHIRIFLYETALIYALHTASRFLSAKTYVDCTIAVSPTTNLVEITVPRLSATQALGWHAGQHAYISDATVSPFLRPFRTANPFTVSSVPSADNGKLAFVARIFDGYTAKMVQQTRSAATETRVPLLVEGPYGLAHHSHTLLSAQRVLFVAGSVGATFIVPLYRQLLADLSPSPAAPDGRLSISSGRSRTPTTRAGRCPPRAASDAASSSGCKSG
ncbi:hypothetical protein MRB53_041010 [Persea americana]|nr:hypothetical protein MRB53_041010 [Persea americana]